MGESLPCSSHTQISIQQRRWHALLRQKNKEHNCASWADCPRNTVDFISEPKLTSHKRQHQHRITWNWFSQVKQADSGGEVKSCTLGQDEDERGEWTLRLRGGRTCDLGPHWTCGTPCSSISHGPWPELMGWCCALAHARPCVPAQP